MNATHCALNADVPPDKLAGHVFLARMGKKLLRPGGREATQRLFELAGLRPDERVCEIATNRAVTAIELAERFGVRVDGVDASPEFLAIAQENIAARGLTNRIHVHPGKGQELPFEDGAFDAVIAEAVITMLPLEQKLATLREAARVLRPGGRLVFHELSWQTPSPRDLRRGLIQTIVHPAWPLTLDEWRELASQVGLRPEGLQTGSMSLMSLRGLLRDEGLAGVVGMAWNILHTPGAWARFKNMAGFFHSHRREFSYVVMKAVKPDTPAQ